MSKKASSKTPSFEDALSELETLVETLEKGDVSLEDSLRQFERGIALARQCKESLQDAERKIQILSEKNAEQPLEPFQPEQD